MSLPLHGLQDDDGGLGGNVFVPEGILRSVSQGPYNYSHRHSEPDEDSREYVRKDSGSTDEAGSSTQPHPSANSSGTKRRTRTSLQANIERPASISAFARPRPLSINVAQHLRRHQRWSQAIPPRALEATDPQTSSSVRSQSTAFDKSAARDPTAAINNQPQSTTSDQRETARPSYVSGLEVLSVRKPTCQQSFNPTAVDEKAGSGNSHQQSPTLQRQGTVRRAYDRAKSRQQQLQRSKSFQLFFRYTCYLLILAFVYFVLVGRPLWGGTVWYLYLLFEYHLTFVGGSAIFIGLAFFYAFGPLLILFEKPASQSSGGSTYLAQDREASPNGNTELQSEVSVTAVARSTSPLSSVTALLIPCYKSAQLLPDTLEAALKVFPATSIFILANGNSPTPLDNTEEVCNRFGVNHVWIPVGSKIVAQYVGSYVARSFPYALLIDDDCLLPPNFPIVTERLRGRVKCLGYTLTSIGENRSRGTWAQQAQDLEYKLSGLQRLFAGKIGSATFPHGAIVLWETEFLIRTFQEHPGYSVSEDWFFGHVARELGSRIIMCTSVFVETETPKSVFFASGGSRGGFGEMTIFKQRFKRWNFFFVNGMWYNLVYIICSWRLGWWEIGAKLFVFQEVYETLLYLITPIVLPISFVVRPVYTSYLFAATLGLYMLNALIFNEVHLRRSGKMVNRVMLIVYYMPFKFALTFVNVASCWWSLWQYAKYFAKRHPRIVEDEKAVGVVLKIEEDRYSMERLQPIQENVQLDVADGAQAATMTRTVSNRPRRMTVTAVRVDIDPLERNTTHESGHHDMYVGPLDKPDGIPPVSPSADFSTTGWIDDWTLERVRSGKIAVRQSRLQDVAEAESEGESTFGYSYYGV